MIQYLFCMFLVHSLVFSEYYSQCGQDKFVNETFFKNHRHGVFVDIGAHNGISFSNTYFFEKELEWTGICVEPIAHVFNQLQKNRTCLCICGCISTDDHNSMHSFLQISGYPEMLSGLIDKFDPKHLSRILHEIQEYGGSYKIIDVPCYNLNKILEDAGIHHVNFLSLDTEGGEFEILQNFDFSKCQVDVITVEDNYRIHPFISLLADKGFEFVTALNQDLIFVHNNLLGGQSSD